MEEKRKDIGTLQPANYATATPSKPSEAMAVEPTSSRRRGGPKRKAGNISGSGNSSTSQTMSLKRQAREKPQAVPFPSIHHNGPCTRARQLPNNNSAASPLDSVALVKSEAADAVAKPVGSGGEAVKSEELKGVKEDLEVLEAKIEAEYKVTRSRGANAHVVPNHCGWFSWNKIHLLEEKSLPSFFNGKSESRTPAIYLEIRNWIINKFHANPDTQIELKDLSELSVGDLEAKQEVMDFLDYWGLMNYHPFLQTESAVLGAADADGLAMTDSLVEKLYRFETELSHKPVVPRTNVATQTVPCGLFPESAVAEESVKSEGPSVEYHCNFCSADCSRKRYHCQIQADYDLCSECFNNGKFDSDMSPSDFILMEPAEAAGVNGGKWTDQETLLLLEALELFKENWNEIAEHVATKTKAQCILHFVQMPIEDMFMDCDDEIDANFKENADPVSTNDDAVVSKDAPASKSADPVSTHTSTSTSKDTTEMTGSKDNAFGNQRLSSPVEISKPEDASEPNVNDETGENCALKALKEAFEAVGSLPSPGKQLSFAEVGNPAMALAAFLVRLAEPNIVAISARSSLKSIMGNSSGVQLAARHCFLLEDPSDDKQKAADSERDVTGMVEPEAKKDETQNDVKQKEKKSDLKFDDSGLSDDHKNEGNKDSVAQEKVVNFSSNVLRADKSCTAKEPDVIGTPKVVEPAPLTKSDIPDLPKEQTPSNEEESNDLTSKVKLPPSSSKDGASIGGPFQSSERVDMTNSVTLEKKESEHTIASSSRVENGANTGFIFQYFLIYRIMSIFKI
ncbi:unnamed protein product [Ilex paraguariensis]|uniref:SWI/SNF complex subunit SWI3D n=1 Tax=Ilex paraguariensis TaxID=185542 RepID=A0ABC8RIR0_9AQUA